MNRGVEISSDVADSEQAIILDQVENGVAVRMAVIYLLASKLIQTRRPMNAFDQPIKTLIISEVLDEPAELDPNYD